MASRRRITWNARTIGALFALLIGVGFMVVFHSYSIPPSVINFGRILFLTLAWLAFAAAAAMGLFLTADCLSEEKRDGTLGLLFLTDLRGHDVVVGKLVSSSLQGIYSLVAMFPILAIPILMGGVTGGEFWRTILALFSTTFLSLGAGMFASAICRDSQKAIAICIALLVLLTGGLAILNAVFSGLNLPGAGTTVTLFSPLNVMIQALETNPRGFGAGLLANQFVTIVLFLGAGWLAPRTWQDSGKGTAPVGPGSRWNVNTCFGRAKGPGRHRLLALNPILWLQSGGGWQAALFWLFAIVAVAGMLLLTLDIGRGAWIFASYSSGLLVLLLYFLAAQVSRNLAEARRDGVLELLLSTPLTTRQIVSGQVRAWVRRFGGPVMIVVCAQGMLSFRANIQTWSAVKTAVITAPAGNATTGAVTNADGTISITNATAQITIGPPAPAVAAGQVETPEWIAALAIAGLGSATVLFNLTAIVWYGLWAGLVSTRAGLASLKTLLFVQVIPWFAITFISTLSAPLLLMTQFLQGNNPASFFLSYTILAAVISSFLAIGKDIFFWRWSRGRLFSELRIRATGEPPGRPTQGITAAPDSLPPIIPPSTEPDPPEQR